MSLMLGPRCMRQAKNASLFAGCSNRMEANVDANAMVLFSSFKDARRPISGAPAHCGPHVSERPVLSLRAEKAQSAREPHRLGLYVRLFDVLSIAISA